MRPEPLEDSQEGKEPTREPDRDEPRDTVSMVLDLVRGNVESLQN